MTNQTGQNPYEPGSASGRSAGATPWPVYGSGATQPGAPDGAGPWPVYGANGSQTGPYTSEAGHAAGSQPYPYGTNGGASPYGTAGGSHSYGSNPPYGSAPGQTGSAAGQNPYPGSPQYGGPNQPPTPGPFPQSASPRGAMPAGSLPSRTGPVLTIIGGIALMIVVAPIVLISLILSGFGISNIVDSSMQAANGGTIIVDETGSVGLIISSNQPYSCTLTSEAGEVVEMGSELDGAVLAARGLTPGSEYVLSCDGVTSADTLVVLDGSTMESMVPSSMQAFGWASLVGVIGLGVLIAGIVWLVRRNRERREVMMTWRW